VFAIGNPAKPKRCSQEGMEDPQDRRHNRDRGDGSPSIDGRSDKTEQRE
jgi:hypothetical protein